MNPPVNMEEGEEMSRVEDINNQLLGADVDERRQSEPVKPVRTKRFSMGVELSKLKGLAQLRSDFLGLNLQPEHSLNIEDSNEEKEEEKVDLPELNLETMKSIQFALNNSIVTQVESLNEETLNSYLEYLEQNYPLNPEDWTRLETRSRELIKDAPKLQVSSLQVHCENDKFLKKYLKARVYFFNSPSYFLETKYQENDGNIVFSSLGSLLTPGIPNALLRIEVYKLSRKTNKDKLVGSAQLRLSEIPNNTQIMRVLDLDTTQTSGLSISFGNLNQKSNHLYLTGCLEDGIAPNVSIPSLLREILTQRLLNLLNLKDLLGDKLNSENGSNSEEKQTLEDELNPEEKPTLQFPASNQEALYAVNLERVSAVGTWELRVHGELWSRTEKPSTLSCILSDILELGSRSRSPSPDPRSPKYSAPSGKQNTAPQKNKRLSLGTFQDTLGSIGALGSLGQDRKGFTQVPILQLADMKPKLIGPADCRFRGTISLNSPVTLSKEDYGSILTSIIIKESNLDWDGKLSNSSSTILKLLEGFSGFENDAERSLFRAVSYIQAYNYSRFPQSLLREHLEIVSRNLQSTSPYLPTILRYIDISSHILQGMQNHSAETVGEVVGNLSVLDQDKVKPKAEYSIRMHAETMFKDWWKKLSEELIPDTQPDRFILVEQKPELDLEQEEKTEPDPLQIKRRRSNLEIITEMLNNNITEAGVKFAPILEKLEINLLNYYAENIENACKTYLWSRSKVNAFISSDLEYIENSEESIHLQQAFNCFHGMRRMAEKVGKEYCSPEILFQDYMEAWVGLSIKKAKLYLRRLASQARKDEIDNIQSQIRHPSRQISEEDLINQQLQTFNFIHESCWTTFDDLPFSSQELEVKCSIQLIQGFNILESRFVTEKTNMYLEDEVLDADEMMKLIKLLDGLRERYLVAGDRLHLLYSNSQLEKDKEKIAETFPTLENMKRMLNEQIQARMENYAHSHSAKFRGYITEKGENKLVTGALVLLDKEIHIISNKFKLTKNQNFENYRKSVCLLLWNKFESELLDFFSVKKQRNNEKNKPSRFNYLRDGISDVISFKQQAMKEEVMNYSSSTALLEMEEELKFLTSSSKSLVSRFLRMKEEYEDNQEVYDGLLLKYRLGYCQEENEIALEICSIQHLNKEGRDKITLEFRSTFFPPRGDHLGIEKKKSYVVDQESWVFDVSDNDAGLDRLIFSYSLDHISNRKSEKEDCFICVDLFKKQTLKSSVVLGDAVFQVCRNGELLPDIPEYTSITGLQSNTHMSTKMMNKEGDEVYKSREYLELRQRKDDLAKSFVKWQNKEKNKERDDPTPGSGKVDA